MKVEIEEDEAWELMSLVVAHLVDDAGLKGAGNIGDDLDKQVALVFRSSVGVVSLAESAAGRAHALAWWARRKQRWRAESRPHPVGDDDALPGLS